MINIKQVKVNTLERGYKFTYGKKNCMVLEPMDDGVLCMVLDETKMQFDTCEEKDKAYNNFAISSLKDELHGSYLDEWCEDGANRNDFIVMEVDLTADDGLKDYGTCTCYLAPRTCNQHREFRDIIPNPTGWEWTATPYSTKSNGYPTYVRTVPSDGSLGLDYYAGITNAVRPLFKLKSDILISVIDEDNDEIDNLKSFESLGIKVGERFKVNGDECVYIPSADGNIYKVDNNETISSSTLLKIMNDPKIVTAM